MERRLHGDNRLRPEYLWSPEFIRLSIGTYQVLEVLSEDFPYSIYSAPCDVFLVRACRGGSLSVLKAQKSRSALVLEGEIHKLASQAQPRQENLVEFHGLYPGISRQTRSFLLMEYCPLGDMYHYFQQHDRSTDECLRISREVLGALAFCHSLGVYHRDLNTRNLFMSTGALGLTAKIGDFGESSGPGVPDLAEYQDRVANSMLNRHDLASKCSSLDPSPPPLGLFPLPAFGTD